VSGSAATLPQTISKATWRLVPFLLLMYILAFLDRANVGFAKESFQPGYCRNAKAKRELPAAVAMYCLPFTE
jgi:hypothetical protein